jgi:UDP-glucose 4-epimerase
MRESVLVTGGAGYIGSHTCLALIQSGWRPIVLDSFVNSNPAAIARLRALTGAEIPVIKGDIRDFAVCVEALRKYDCKSVIHFAGLKAVGESQERALQYYDVNVNGSHSILHAMIETGVTRMIFSSSATVYGAPVSLPITETHPLAPTNPYGQTKLAVEQMIIDVANSDADIQFGILRYFNPVGADESAEIGEDPKGRPNNLMPYIAQVAIGRRDFLSIYGNDYDTADGTGVRDYIHVSDLANAHVKALEKLSGSNENYIVNLGTGRGYSVLEVIAEFEAASGCSIERRITDRRSGDVATVFADPRRAEELLGWKAERKLDEMCIDHWRWQKNNPLGYNG